ncbi:tRNA epoxyqueuosine(34) reductase QueG [bacterium]|nr:MAG: tRNA epoxyqueuosine(34) reductase QueG [bacterium]
MMVPQDGLMAEASRLGFDACGITPAVQAPHLDFFDRWIGNGNHASMDWLANSRELRADPQSVHPGARSIVAVALNYNQPNPAEAGQPRIARYALGRDYHKVLRKKLKALGAWVEANHPGESCRACVDSAPIFERDYARLAGLGWFGKNTMLIDSRRGSWFFIGLLLTTVDFETSSPAEGGCGSCHVCIEACPTGAIVFRDGRWQIDARRCISYLTIEHEGPLPDELDLAGWTFGCDVCQEVCPFNQPRSSQPIRATVTREADFLRRRDWPSLRELAQISESEWDGLTQGSPVRRTGIDGLRRNARAGLASIGRPDDTETVSDTGDRDGPPTF